MPHPFSPTNYDWEGLHFEKEENYRVYVLGLI